MSVSREGLAPSTHSFGLNLSALQREELTARRRWKIQDGFPDIQGKAEPLEGPGGLM